HGERVVETPLGAELRDLLRRRARRQHDLGRISGEEGQEERDDRHTEDDENRGGETRGDVGPQLTPSSPADTTTGSHPAAARSRSAWSCRTPRRPGRGR